MKQFFLVLIITSVCEGAWANMLNGGKQARDEAAAEAIRQGILSAADKAEMLKFINEGRLVPIETGEFFVVEKMEHGYPYVLPETRDFLRRLGVFWLEHCNERLVITSALRPKNSPVNSIDNTVHPTGMAVDIRNYHLSRHCRDWVESKKRWFESAGIIQATKEHRHPHYHLVVYPEQFRSFQSGANQVDGAIYRVRSGDTLGVIAKRFGSSINKLVTLNHLDSPDFLRRGQIILVQ
jgi:hypothetical protein